MAPTFAELVKRNDAYAEIYQPAPYIAEIQASGAPPPKTCIVTCVDPRVFPERLLGLNMGEAFIFRTIAGRPHLVLRDIVTLDAQSEGFENLILLHHTDCGATLFKDDWLRSEISKASGEAGSVIEEMPLATIHTSVEQCLRDDIKWIKEQPLIREGLAKAIKGFMFDIKTGKIYEIESDAQSGTLK